jgi:FKBP-type peptidyl-prolyl cis-trans isomerase FkpA
MKKSIFLLAAAVGLFATSCQNFKKAEGGLEYKIVKDEGAVKATDGDHLFVDMIVTSDRNDSLIQSTYDIGLPQYVNVVPDTIPGNYKGSYSSMFKYLGEGDSAVFRLNLDTMAAKSGQPKLPIGDKFLTFTIKVRKHFKKAELPDSIAHVELDKYYRELIANLEKAEAGKIESYVKDNKLEPKKTASDLQYVIKEEGKGAKPAIGDTVKVNYVGKLTHGKVFDTSIKEEADKAKLPVNPMRTFEPIKFTLGVDPVIPAWVEGLQLLSKGGKATLIIPSKLAYGSNGQPQGGIPPYAPLIFDVELVDIIKGTAPKADSTATPAPAPTR